MDNIQLKQNLKDAGCTNEISESIMARIENGNLDEALRMIKKIRCQAMEELHKSGRKVDCIDYMIRKLEK